MAVLKTMVNFAACLFARSAAFFRSHRLRCAGADHHLSLTPNTKLAVWIVSCDRPLPKGYLLRLPIERLVASPERLVLRSAQFYGTLRNYPSRLRTPESGILARWAV